ncbi:MAG: hypothetical protein SGPRY_006203 [Prymnesium sp.]
MVKASLEAGRGGPRRCKTPLNRLRLRLGGEVDARAMEASAYTLLEEGRIDEALPLLEAALAEHQRQSSSHEAKRCSRTAVDACNSSAMQLLQYDRFTECYKLLKHAEALCRHHGSAPPRLASTQRAQLAFTIRRPMLAVTLNNLACYHRRRGHTKIALSLLLRALDVESRCQAHKPADTHLNMCVVLSQELSAGEGKGNGRVEKTDEQELSQIDGPVHAWARAKAERGDGESEINDSLAAPSAAPTARVTVLAICMHNLGIEQERLGLRQVVIRLPLLASSDGSEEFVRPSLVGAQGRNPAPNPHAGTERAHHTCLTLLQEAIASLDAAALIAMSHVGEDHPITITLKHARAAVRKPKLWACRRPISAQIAQSSVSRPSFTASAHRPALPSCQLSRPQPLWAQDAPPLAGRADAAKPALLEWVRGNLPQLLALGRAWDVDQLGTLSRRDFFRAMRELGSPATQRELAALFDRIDHRSLGCVDLEVRAELLTELKVELAKCSAVNTLERSTDLFQRRVQLTQACPT